MQAAGQCAAFGNCRIASDVTAHVTSEPQTSKHGSTKGHAAVGFTIRPESCDAAFAGRIPLPL